MSKLSAFFVVFRAVAPSVLASLGAVAALLYSEGFHAFCGLQ